MTNFTWEFIVILGEVRVLKMVNGTDKDCKGVVVTCFKEILKFPFREAREKPLKLRVQSHDWLYTFQKSVLAHIICYDSEVYNVAQGFVRFRIYSMLLIVNEVVCEKREKIMLKNIRNVCF